MNKFSTDVRARAVRMVLDRQAGHASRPAAISSIAAKIACMAGTLRLWATEAEGGLYKVEVDDRRGPRRSFAAVEFATLEWVAWFNNRRVVEAIGQIPPAEAEARYYATKEPPVMTANIKLNSRRQTRRGSPCRH